MTGVPVRPGMYVHVVNVELTHIPGEGAGQAPCIRAVFQARAWRKFPFFILNPAGNSMLRGWGVSGPPPSSLAWHLCISSQLSGAQAQGLPSLPDLSPSLSFFSPPTFSSVSLERVSLCQASTPGREGPTVNVYSLAGVQVISREYWHSWKYV